jgi:hypothetical protein
MLPKEKIKQIQDLARQDKRAKEIAYIADVPYHCVITWTKGMRKTFKDKIRAMDCSEMTPKEIAKAVGCTYEHSINLVNLLKIKCKRER